MLERIDAKITELRTVRREITPRVAWPVAGLGLSLAWLSNVEASAFGLAVGMTVVGVGAGIGAAWAYWSGHRRPAGGLYLLSAVTPTGFAYLGNLVAIAVGMVLVFRKAPSSPIRRPRERVA